MYSLDTVQANFRRYGLLDDRVKFLPGWFRDTLPVAPVERIAVLRLDGDMYESTHLALTHLYPKLSSGGFLIVDDYGALPNCRRAVEDFRHTRHYRVDGYRSTGPECIGARAETRELRRTFESTPCHP